MQLVLGAVTVHVAPPGDAVTVYEDGVPPVVGGEIVIVALPFPGAAVGVPGVPGSAIVHCAVKVLFEVTFVTEAPALLKSAPSLQPLKVKPFLLGAAATKKPRPCDTFACVGAVPEPPFSR